MLLVYHDAYDVGVVEVCSDCARFKPFECYFLLNPGRRSNAVRLQNRLNDASDTVNTTSSSLSSKLNPILGVELGAEPSRLRRGGRRRSHCQ